MRKLAALLTIVLSFMFARKILRRILARDIWDENIDLAAQCLRHFSAIESAQDRGELTSERLRWHLVNIKWYACQIVDPIHFPKLPYDREINLSYGNFWLGWSSDRLEELKQDKTVSLSLIAS